MRLGGELLRPARVRPGDVVAVATPSGPARYPRRLARGVAALERRGFVVRIGGMASATRFEERTAEARAAELNEFLRDGSVRAIFTSIGGHNSNTLIDLVDWQALRNDPKPLIGYSDITALLSAALTRAGVVAFHGPTVLPELAEFPDVQSGTIEPLLRAVMHAEPLGAIEATPSWTEELLAWEQEDDRPRSMRSASPWRWGGRGTAQGPLVGGNIETLCKLAGTGELPQLGGAVVLLEAAGTSLAELDSHLSHLRTATDLDMAAGIIAGHTARGGDGFEERWQSHLTKTFSDSGIPILLGVHAGHTDPMPTLPLGVQVRLNAQRRTWEVLDAGVR